MLREYYKAEYKKALQEKVEHQRKTIQQRQSKLEEQVKMSQEHEVCTYNIVHLIEDSKLVTYCDSHLQAFKHFNDINNTKTCSLQEEMRHKVPHRLPRSMLVNDSQFKDGLSSEYYKVSPSICKLYCKKLVESF